MGNGKTVRAAVLAVLIVILGAAVGCGDGPTQVPAASQNPPIARNEQVCVIVDGVRYCIPVTATAHPDTMHP